MCHSSGTAAPEGRHDFFFFLLKACGICFDVERCLLAFKDATPCGPPWCDPTEDEKPKLRSWVARTKHLKLNSHKRKVQRIRIALLPPYAVQPLSAAAAIYCTSLTYTVCDMQHQSQPGITWQWSWFMQTNRKCLDSRQEWHIMTMESTLHTLFSTWLCTTRQ